MIGIILSVGIIIILLIVIESRYIYWPLIGIILSVGIIIILLNGFNYLALGLQVEINLRLGLTLFYCGTSR